MLRGENVLVTGGAGFIGSALVRELLKEEANIVVLDSFLSGDLSNLEEVRESIKIQEGDILETNFKDFLISEDIEYVFNLAAEPYIPHCYDRPAKFFEINANGALNVLLSCKEAGVKRIIQYSTSEVYGSARYVPMDENHPTVPLSTYAVSKLAADRLSFTLFHEQGIPVIILRQFNTYGPRATQPYIIPEIISQLSKGNNLKLGNTKARRDLTYIEDSAKAAIALMKCEDAVGEVINVGSGVDWSVGELVDIIGRLMGYEEVKIEIQEERLRPLDVERLQCNYFRMYKLTGWNPTVGIEEGLKSTIDYYTSVGNRWLWEEKFVPEDEMWKRK